MINPFVRDYFKNKRIEKNFKLDTGDKIIDGGVNVIGYINSEFGLGHMSRCFIDAIQKSEIPMNIIEKKLNNKNTSNYYKTYNKFDYSVNIHSYNPSTENSNFKELFKNRYNIGIWFFELETLSENWKKLSENYDEIWATTSFLEDLFKKELPGKKVRRINHPLPSVSKLDKNESKSYFEINRDGFVCLFIFDFHSDFYRKNPLAVIETFQKTFKNEKVRLIIKSHSGTTEQVNLINQKIKSDSRITHYSENWPSKDINILMNACDVYISLHRSEGLGLTLLEAIALEKPTLCTNYSGNLDFCKPEWSELVDYEMIEIDKNSDYFKHYGMQNKSVKWANPKVEEASLKLRKIYDNYSDYEKRAKKGRQWILENYNIDKISKEVKRIFDSKFDYKWEEFIDICSDLIQHLPKQFPIVDKSSKKKSLIVECRKLKHNEFVIKNTIQKLGDGWGHIIYCHKNNYNQIKSICDEISSDIEIRLVEKDLDRNDYNNLMLSIDFWNKINCEKVLIYQTDTFILNKFDDSFLEYDYLGANWGPGTHMDFLKEKLNIENDLTNGNGGLSIRNIKNIKNSLKDDDFKYRYLKSGIDIYLDTIPEDVYFSLWNYLKKGKMKKDCSDFCIEPSVGHKEKLNFDEIPFAFHKLYDFDGWEFFIEKFKLNLKIKKIIKNIEEFNDESYEIKKNHNLCKSKISVIITNYNYSKYLKNCINSIKSNNLKDVEIVIVDDNSTDESHEIINLLLKENNSNITAIFKKKNTHVSHSRNLGIKKSIGENVFILDCDNEIYPDCLKKHLEYMEEKNIDAAYSIIECFDETDNFIIEISNSEYSIEKMKKGNYIDSMAMFKKSSILEIGGYNEELLNYGIGWEDYDLWLVLGKNGFKIGFIEEKLSKYRIKKTGMLNSENTYYQNDLKLYINKKYFES